MAHDGPLPLHGLICIYRAKYIIIHNTICYSTYKSHAPLLSPTGIRFRARPDNFPALKQPAYHQQVHLVSAPDLLFTLDDVVMGSCNTLVCAHSGSAPQLAPR